jgi:hypothetical protein
LIDYNADLFEASTILTMLEQYEFLLNQIVSHPTRSVLDTPLIRPTEKANAVVHAAALPQAEHFDFDF